MLYVVISLCEKMAGRVEFRSRLSINDRQVGNFVAYTAMGDSITEGCRASEFSKSYVQLIGQRLGVIPVNYGVSGSQTIDLTRTVYSIAARHDGRQLFTYMTGTNDATYYGTHLIRALLRYKMCQAQLAWLCLPERCKSRAQSCGIEFSKGWEDSEEFGGKLARRTNIAGATAQFRFFGQVGYLAHGIREGNRGDFELLVDGEQYIESVALDNWDISIATFSASDLIDIDDTRGIRSQHGVDHGSALIRIVCNDECEHVVELRVISETAADSFVWIDWVGQAAGSAFVDGPTVVVGIPPRTLRNDRTIRLYAPYIRDCVSPLAADGLNVCIADTAGYLNPATDLADDVHPNDEGMAAIAEAFLATIARRDFERARIAAYGGRIRKIRQTFTLGGPVGKCEPDLALEYSEPKHLESDQPIADRITQLTWLDRLRGRRGLSLAEIRASGFFDGDWYLGRYEDVRVAGVDPLEHFLTNGQFEGRLPGPGFNPDAYLRENPRARRSRLSTFQHFIRNKEKNSRPEATSNVDYFE